MPEPKKTLVFFEGDDDKAFLEKLREAGIWPDGWQLATRDKNQHAGKDGLVRQLLPVVSPQNGIGGHAVVLVDLDELSTDQVAAWFKGTLVQELKKTGPEVKVQEAPPEGNVRALQLAYGDTVGRVALVAVGCPGDDELKNTFKIDRFAIDDWVFRLALHPQVFEAVSDFKDVKYAIARAKYLEVSELFRKNGLEVRRSKTYMQILRALASIRPSTATIVGRIVKKAVEMLGKDDFCKVLQPFIEDLQAAAQILSRE